VLRPGRHEPAPPSAATTAPQSGGQFIALDAPRPAPDLSFTARSGEAKKLADFRGRLVLVNLWATWCVPCVEEMPALDRLQGKLGSDLTIIAISEDRRGAEIVDPFLAKTGIKNLAIYLDPKSTALNEFAVQGLPTSFLIDRDGMIRGKLEGAAKWDEPAMVAILQRYIAAK
jgi:thiol-disulfide isomerase/thioredoxin